MLASLEWANEFWRNSEGGLGQFLDPDYDKDEGVGVLPVLDNELIDAVAKAIQDLLHGFDSLVKGHVHLHRLTGTRISAVGLPCSGVVSRANR